MRGGFEKGRSPAPLDDEVNLGTIGRALWHNKRSIIGPALIMAAAAFIGVNSMTPRYKSEARVLVESRENIFLRPEAEKALTDRSGVDQETVTSQVQLVLSRDLARAVIKQLNLTRLPEFNAALKGFSPLSLLQYIGLAKNPLSMSLEERVLAAYYDRLSAYAIEKSRVIAIEFQSADPALAARAANAIAEKYLTFQQMAKQDQARSAGRWLSRELDNLRRKVSVAEGKVEAFRAKSNLFVGTNNTSLTNQQLTELSSQVSAARAQKADAEVRARLIRDALRTGKLPESSDIANSDLIRRLSEQRVTLRTQLAEQSSTLLPQHPRIKEMKAQIADLDQQIRSEGERLARSLENDAKVAGARLESLSANLDQLKRQTASTSDQDVQLRALEREAKAQRDLFESYLAKYREANARDSIAAAPADARVISRAVVSNVPHFPKKLPIVLIAAFATFCLSTAFVTTSALLGGASYRPAPLRVDTSPATPNAAAPAVRPAPTPTIDEVAAALRQAGDHGRRVTVIGSARNVGTAPSAIALARALAQTSRVVLVDLAFGAPNIAVISEHPSAPGIADLVRGTASFGDIITRDRSSRLHLVGAGQVGADAEELINAPMLSAAVGALAQSYDHLVIDAGSPSEAALAAIVAMAPQAVLVGEDAAADALKALADHLRSIGFVAVTVLTGPPPRLDHPALQSTAA
ncbi:MAG: exopolysaccharide transport family protein [Xanthobacteraceae bacterium]